MAASLPSNLTPAQFTAATGNAPTPTLTASQLATQNQVNAQKASPAGTVQTPYNFVPVNSVQTNSNGQPSTINGVSLPSGTLNANISTPASNSTTTNPPAVITSTAAQNDVNNMQGQVSQLNSDVANQQQTNQNNAATAATNQSAQQQSSNSGAGSNGSSSSSTGNSSDTGIPSLDDQINQLLGGLTDSTNTINSNAQQTEGGLLSAEDANQQAQNASYAQTAQQLQAIASGTYPLSASEQQLLTATASQFQTSIQQQIMANQNAVASAQMTGLATNSTGESIALMQNAITNGNLAVSKINAQMATSIATLQQGFQKQDFDMIQSAWTDAAKQFEDRQSELQSMLTTVQTQATAQADELQKNAQMNITATIQSAQFTYTQKEDAIKNALAQGTLDEKTADDATKNLIAEYTAGMTGGSGSGNGLPTVAVSSTGTPDPVAQAQFLTQFSPQVASLIQGVANYTINPSSIPTSKKQAMGGMTQSQIVALASQYNPNYDEKSYATRAAMQKNITSGQYSQTITSANTLVNHLAKLQADYNSLGNTGVFGFALNPIKNTEMNALGSGKTTAVNTDIAAVASEAAKIYKGTGAATDQEITDWQNNLSVNSSPSQMKAAIDSMTELMGGKLSTLSDNYQQVMGQQGNFQILTDQSAKTLQSLGIDPSTVDPTYGNSPTVKLSNFNGASTQNAQLLQQINQIMPNADPADVVQYLQSKGYTI